MSSALEAALKKGVCDLIAVDRTADGYELILPQAYHSGHAVAVSVIVEGDGYLVHDNSYAAMLLESLGVRATARVEAGLRSGVVSYGCELSGLRVSRRCYNVDELALAIVLVGCASRLVADHALKVDATPIFDFKSKLLGRVIDTVGQKRVRENQPYPGHSGSTYQVAAVVLDKPGGRPIAFVEAVADHNAVARRFREFYDLMQNPALVGIDRVAVYDDSRRDIAATDILLLQDVSNPVRFADSITRFTQMGTYR